MPERPLAITIDDGSSTVATLFEPLAAKVGIAYTAAIVTAWVNDSEGKIIDVGNGLDDTILTWPEVHKLANTGRVAFISHSHDQHRYGAGDVTGAQSGPAIMTRLWLVSENRQETETERQRRVYADLATSRDVLREQFGTPSTLLAWPYGMHDDKAEAAAMDAGYTHFLEFGSQHVCLPAPETTQDTAAFRHADG